MVTATAEATELATRLPSKNAVLYSVTAETIAARKAELLALKINGVDDAKGLAEVKAKLKEVVGWRTGVEKTRTELKADVLEAGRRIDAEAKAIQALIAPIENHLATEKKRVDDELARIEQEKLDAVYEARAKRLAAVGAQSVGRDYLMSLGEAAFDVYVENERARIEGLKQQEAELRRQEEERKRLAAEEAERNRLEKERLDAERAELDRQRKADEQRRAAEQQALLKQQEEIAEARRQIQRDEEKAKAVQRAAMINSRTSRLFPGAFLTDDELATMTEERFEAFLRDAREAEEARLAAIREEAAEKERLQKAREEEEAAERAAEALRLEELKPELERINEFADKVAMLPLPKVRDKTAESINQVLADCAEAIRQIGKQL